MAPRAGPTPPSLPLDPSGTTTVSPPKPPARARPQFPASSATGTQPKALPATQRLATNLIFYFFFPPINQFQTKYLLRASFPRQAGPVTALIIRKDE